MYNRKKYNIVIMINSMKDNQTNASKTTPKCILICRTDKLGDFVLSLPSFELLKRTLPDTKIIALTQEYTKPIAELCGYIDEVITIPRSDSAITTIKNTIRILKPIHIDVSISLFTTATLAIGLLFSKISFRVSPATKIDQLFYTHRLRQRRSQSLKPEYEYNLDLIKYYLTQNNINFNDIRNTPLIKFQNKTVLNTKKLFCTKNNIQKLNKLIFVHVGSGGSANNLPPHKYADLINLLASNLQATFVLCEGPEDASNVTQTIALLKTNNFIRYISNQGLLEFTKHIAIADFFISGSTGPLHIAGALDIATAGFYPNRRSATATRWKTLNSNNNLMAFSPAIDDLDDMSKINIEQVCSKIQAALL